MMHFSRVSSSTSIFRIDFLNDGVDQTVLEKALNQLMLRMVRSDLNSLTPAEESALAGFLEWFGKFESAGIKANQPYSLPGRSDLPPDGMFFYVNLETNASIAFIGGFDQGYDGWTFAGEDLDSSYDRFTSPFRLTIEK